MNKVFEKHISEIDQLKSENASLVSLIAMLITKLPSPLKEKVILELTKMRPE